MKLGFLLPVHNTSKVQISYFLGFNQWKKITIISPELSFKLTIFLWYPSCGVGGLLLVGANCIALLLVKCMRLLLMKSLHLLLVTCIYFLLIFAFTIDQVFVIVTQVLSFVISQVFAFVTSQMFSLLRCFRCLLVNRLHLLSLRCLQMLFRLVR